MTNKLFATIQKTKDNNIHFCKKKFRFHDIILLSVIDASFGGEISMEENKYKQEYRFQGGRFLLIIYKSFSSVI